MHIVVISILIILFFLIYFFKPKKIFLYWLSISPYILPIFYRLFQPFFIPYVEKFQPILEDYPGAIIFLMFLLSCVSLIKVHNRQEKVKTIILPGVLLVLFVFFHNVLVGFDVRAFLAKIRDILWIIVPFMLLSVNKKVRPSRDSFINFIYFFVYIQTFFCFLNLFGFKIYGNLNDVTTFDDLLISGTFPRYNHMANYLAIFFFILSYEYMENKGVKRRTYFLTTFLIGLLIIMSGSRMTLLLTIFTILFFICTYQNKKNIFLTLMAFVLLIGIYIIGNDNFVGKKADDGTGVERNLIGIVELANSDDLSEGSTLSMSAKVLFFYSNSPILGNGKAYRKEYFYGKPTDAYHNEGSFKVDARLAFMFVEYGIVGLSLFFLLYVSIFRGCYFYSEEHKKKLYWGAGLYFLIYSITDPGFWDYVIFSSLLIYVFSEKTRGKMKQIQSSI